MLVHEPATPFTAQTTATLLHEWFDFRLPVVGRVTPCAPLAPGEALSSRDGAHGVTRPTSVKRVPISGSVAVVLRPRVSAD